MAVKLKIILFLSLCLLRVSAFTSFPDKMVLAEEGSSVTLTCHAESGGIVTWTRNGHPMNVEDSEVIKVVGMELTLSDLGLDLAGNYTCWRGGVSISSTYLLIDITRDYEGPYFSCLAENYSCSFTCSWDATDFTAFRFRNERDNGTWVSTSKGGEVILNHSTNPYTEEAEPVLVTGEAISSEQYLRIRRPFYLRQIIQPASPRVKACERRGGLLQVKVVPPVSWATPLSYYPLEHEIEYQNRDNGERNRMMCGGVAEGAGPVDCVSMGVVPGGVSKLRLRCRDSVVSSHWSNWSPWKNVRKKKTICVENRGNRKDRRSRRKFARY